MTAASAAAVEAAQKELGCSIDPHGHYCLECVIVEEAGICYDAGDERAAEWTQRGCEFAVRVADAVVEAQDEAHFDICEGCRSGDCLGFGCQSMTGRPKP